MKRFLFHLWTADGRSEDAEGCEFESLEAAYLDVHRAIIEMSAEMLAERRDPTCCAFEICDGGGERLMMVSFREALRPGPQSDPPPFWALCRRLESNLRRGRELNCELVDRITEVRRSMEALRETMKALG